MGMEIANDLLAQAFGASAPTPSEKPVTNRWTHRDDWDCECADC